MAGESVGLLLLAAGLATGALAAGSDSAWPSAYFNTLYSPVVDPGGVPSTSLSPPPLPPSLGGGGVSGRSGKTLRSFASLPRASFAPELVSSSPSFDGYPTGPPTETSLLEFTPRLVLPDQATGFAGLDSGSAAAPGVQGGALAAVAPRTASTLPAGPGLTVASWPAQVVAIAEGAGKIFARTFRAFRGTAADTVKFELFTRKQPTNPIRIYARKRSSVEQSTYDPSKPTKILIHGFLSHQGPGSGGNALKNAFLSAQDCNVITVDWSGADPREYSSAVRLAVPKVGAEVAELLRLLADLGTDLNDVHVLGHSLGGQIAGAAGSQVLGPAGAGRITALDPAGPLFDGRDAAHRLDPSDAAFVDVVHTDGGQLGYARPTGHADFFPGGGRHAQPGCGKDVVGVCSHCLVYDLMIDSLLRPGANVYRKCNSWQAYKSGGCSNGDNAVMGIYTDPRSRGSFFLEANTSVRNELRKAGDKDLVQLLMIRKNSGGRDGVMVLQC